MISPLARVPSAHQVGRLMESLKNFTLPSVIRAFTPPMARFDAGPPLTFVRATPAIPRSGTHIM